MVFSYEVSRFVPSRFNYNTRITRETLIQVIDKRVTLRSYVIFIGDERRRRANRDS